MKTWMLFLLCFLIGCSADATPVAVIAPTTDQASPATAEPTTAVIQEQPLRYGILPHVMGFALPDSDPSVIEIVDSNADVNLYDVVIAYGIVDGWQQAPQPRRISLLINTQLAPLNQTTITSIVRTVPRPAELLSAIPINGMQFITDQEVDSLTIRTQLANNGYPDGLSLTLAYEDNFVLEFLLEQFQASRITINAIPNGNTSISTILSNNQAHIGLVTWVTAEEKIALDNILGAENIIDLLAIPISYRVREGYSVIFNEEGFPVIPR